MYSTVRTAVLDGISAIPIQVEVDISTGMPVFDMVGNLTSEVREAKERVKTALHSVGIVLPAKRITVNLFGIRSFYECSVHRFCKKSRQRKAYSF